MGKKNTESTGGITDQLFDQYGNDIEQGQGILSDWKAADNYETARKELNDIAQGKAYSKRFSDLSNRINMFTMSGDLDKVPMHKTEDRIGINPDHPDFLPLYDRSIEAKNPVVKEYLDYFDNASKIPDKKPLQFTEYLDHYPQLKELMTPQHFKNTPVEIPMTDKEFDIASYHAAGFNDDDIDFLKKAMQNKDALSEDDYNNKIKKMVYGAYPYLMSKGSKGDVYAKMLGLQGEDAKIVPQKKDKNEYQFLIKDGKLIRGDKNTGKYSVDDIDPNADDTDPKDWKVFTDENGDYGEPGSQFLGERVKQKDGSYKIVFRDKLNKRELDDETAREHKRDRTDEYAPTGRNNGTRRRRGPSSKKETKFNTWKPEDFKKLKTTDLDSYDIGELNKLKDYKKLLPKDVQDALKTKLKGQMSSDDNTGDNTGDNSGTKKGNLKNQKGMGEYERNHLEGANENEKTAMNNVNGWIKDTIKQWGRNNLTADEWKKEIYDENWDDTEWEIIKQYYKDKFGTDLE